MKPKRRSLRASPAPAADAGAIANVLCARVRELRKQKRWTLEELAAASGVSRSMLSDIERGRANPTLVIAQRIALALGLSLAELIEMPSTAPGIEVIRADDRTYHFRSDRRCRIRTLSPLGWHTDVEFYEIVIGPDGALRRAPHFHGTRELLTVQRGTVRLRAGDETAELRAGDAARYPGDVEHAIENLGREDAVLYQVVTCPREAAGDARSHPVRLCRGTAERRADSGG